MNKTIEFNGCKAQYLYSPDNFAKENSKNGGHGRHNEFNLFDANQEIALCLSEKYSKTRDPKSKEFILRHYNSDYSLKHQYLWSVLSFTAPIDSLCKYKEEIFKDDGDQKMIALCSKYETTHDQSLKTQILHYYQDENNGSFAVGNIQQS